MKIWSAVPVLLAVVFAPATLPAQQAFSYTLGLDQLEYRANRGDDLVHFDLTALAGNDRHKLHLAAGGELYTMGRSRGDLEFQLDYGAAISESWDLHAGVREEVLYGPGSDRQRTQAVIGVRGLAPLRIEVTPEIFVSHDGETAARLGLQQVLELTPTLAAAPQLELNVAFQNAERFGIRSGATDLELGLRVRYERWARCAPYLGVQWRRLLGDTADLAQDDGDGVDEIGLVVGLSLVY